MPMPALKVSVRLIEWNRLVAKPIVPPTTMAVIMFKWPTLKAMESQTSADLNRQIKGKILARFTILADDLGDSVGHG